MDIIFNDYKLPNVISCRVQRVTRNTKAEYNANGDMLIDMVSRKHILTVYSGGHRASELQKLFAVTNAAFFTVSFVSPVLGRITSQFHMKEQIAETDYVYKGITYYKALKLVLEER